MRRGRLAIATTLAGFKFLPHPALTKRAQSEWRTRVVTAEVVEFTAEGPPSSPPDELVLTTLSSQIIKANWRAPPESSANGIIKGYKVVFGPSATWYDESTRNTKVSTETETEIHGLKKYTNYSMQVHK